MARRDAPVFVEIPEAGADRPLWGKVGLVAAAGFVIGVAWPRLTSTRIAPSPPSDNAAVSEPSAPASAAAVSAPPVAARSSAPPVARTTATAAAPAPTTASPTPTTVGPVAAAANGTGQGAPNGAGPSAAIVAPRGVAATREPVVGTGFILHCRDEQQDVEDCGSFTLDPVAVPKIKGLARCPAAKGASGKLSLGFDVDFRAKAVRVLLGKSTSLPRDAADGLVHCSEAAFQQLNWAALPHDHRQYTVFYSVRFGEGAANASTSERPPVASPAPPGADGSSAFIAWDVALLRDTPKSGAIVERLLKGAKVKVLGHDGNWFRVQYGTIQGWVYREAIGL